MNISDNRFRHGLCGLVLAGLLVFTGCATTGTKAAPEAKKDASAASTEKKKEKVSVEYINVVGEGDRVMIGTTGTIHYTVFKLTEPSRLIVDMPGVDLSKVVSSIDVNNDYLNTISAISYGEDQSIGRIIINLKDDIDHDVKSGENSILVSLKKADAQAKAQAPAENGEVAKASLPEQVKSEPLAAKPEPAAEPAPAVVPEANAPAAETQPAEAPAPMKRAARILKVESSAEGENTVVKITADGLLGNFNSFDLASPSRIVVDIWGVDSAVGKNTVKLKDKFVKDVRIGAHKDKSRLVLDLTGKSVTPHSVKRDVDSIIVTIGPNVTAEKEAAVAEVSKAAEAKMSEPSAPAPSVVASAAPAPAPVQKAEKAEAQPAMPVEAAVKVENVDFKKLGPLGRLTISNSAKPEYSVKESEDGMTVVIDLKDAKIPDELSRTLDATKLGTTVATISSYQESSRPASVRVLVKLSEKTPYEVKEENGTINLDFQAPAPETAAQPVKTPAKPVVEKKGYTGKKIDLDMMDANISDVLRLLAEVSNLNIVASDEVKGTISLRLKNVPWDQAFDIILKSKDLDSVKEGNVIRVAPAAKIRQEKEALLAAKKAQEKLEDLDIRFISVNYANAADLIKQVQSVLTERGSVSNDARTNTLIVKDVKLGIAAADNLVKKLDTKVPQVLIEARIVEATSSFARDLGIQWGFDYGTGGNLSTQTFGDTSAPGHVLRAQTPNSTIQVSGNDQFAVNLPAAGTAGTLGALGFVLGKAGQNPFLLDLRLSAGESEGRLKTISRPRITTMDNKEAKIEQGESIPFETTSASGTQTIFIDANLSLTVTPHITPDGSVLMKIKASRNSIGVFRTSSGQPSINKKESTTDVLVKDGETTVIGGIVISDKNDTDKGIPYLKDIPILGWLFKNKSVSDSQQELLIFITPTIVKDKIVG